MKTARRENRKDWAEVFSNPRHGAAGQNRTCSNTWGWKQEKLQRWERCFLLTSSSIERFYDSAYRYRLGSILHGCSRSNPDLRLMGSRNDAALSSRSRRVLKKVIVYHPRRLHGTEPLHESRESWHACECVHM